MELGDTLRRNAEEDGVDGPELKVRYLSGAPSYLPSLDSAIPPPDTL
jgi:hypothetical protein